MYAVIKAGGHQYKVSEGDVVKVDFHRGNEGDAIKFDQVLLVGGTGSLQVGAPTLSGASVEAVIRRQKRDPKIIVFKFKRRKNYKRTKGHKQPVTEIEIKKINS